MNNSSQCGRSALKPMKRHEVRETRIGEELVVSYDDTKETFFLNSTARYMWESCDGATTLEQIAAGLKESHDVSGDTDVVADLLELYDVLHQKGLLR